MYLVLRIHEIYVAYVCLRIKEERDISRIFFMTQYYVHYFNNADEYIYICRDRNEIFDGNSTKVLAIQLSQ